MEREGLEAELGKPFMLTLSSAASVIVAIITIPLAYLLMVSGAGGLSEVVGEALRGLPL